MEIMDTSTDPPDCLFVMGVSGSGKSTVGEALARRLGWGFRDGDDLHPAANRARMAAGHPLTDDDRWPWLDAIVAWVAEQHAAGASVVVPCSALRRVYRDRLRRVGPGVRFVYLAGPHEVLAARLAGRTQHFMPSSLLDSQLATLEPPAPDEGVLSVSIEQAPDAIVDHVLAWLPLGPR